VKPHEYFSQVAAENARTAVERPGDLRLAISARPAADIFFRGFPDQSRWCVPAIAASASFAWRGEGVHRVLLCEAIPCDLEQRPTAWLSQRRPAARRT
jgi:hypothetical protein